MDSITSEYKEFIKKYFPCSGILNDPNIESIYYRICENNLITDIYEKYIGDKTFTNISCQIIFLQNYRIQFNKLLLYLPLNDNNCINFCMRAVIENLLKFLYSIYFKENYNNISKCKFRDIRERLNKINANLFMDKNKFNILFSYYGEFSNSIHDKSYSTEQHLNYLGSIIEANCLNLDYLDKKLLNILNCYEELICTIFKIEERTFSMSENLRLKNSLTPKRVEKIKQFLYKEEEQNIK